MKIIDNNGRLFGKISVIDVLVVAVVAVMAAALYVKSNQTHTGTSVVEETIAFQVLVEGVPGYVQNAIQVEDQLYDKVYESGGPLGRVTQIEVLPGSELAEFDDGTMALAPVEDCFNLLLTVEGKGLVSEGGGYTINRVYDLGVNAARTYYTKYAEFEGTVTRIL